jgi:hypothetical protein
MPAQDATIELSLQGGTVARPASPGRRPELASPTRRTTRNSSACWSPAIISSSRSIASSRSAWKDCPSEPGPVAISRCGHVYGRTRGRSGGLPGRGAGRQERARVELGTLIRADRVAEVVINEDAVALTMGPGTHGSGIFAPSVFMMKMVPAFSAATQLTPARAARSTACASLPRISTVSGIPHVAYSGRYVDFVGCIDRCRLVFLATGVREAVTGLRGRPL